MNNDNGEVVTVWGYQLHLPRRRTQLQRTLDGIFPNRLFQRIPDAHLNDLDYWTTEWGRGTGIGYNRQSMKSILAGPVLTLLLMFLGFFFIFRIVPLPEDAPTFWWGAALLLSVVLVPMVVGHFAYKAIRTAWVNDKIEKIPPGT